jgi:NADPH:quinone reductase
MLGAKGSLYVTRQTLFTHIATREATQAMADDCLPWCKAAR